MMIETCCSLFGCIDLRDTGTAERQGDSELKGIFKRIRNLKKQKSLLNYACVHIVFGVSYETLQTMCFRSNYR